MYTMIPFHGRMRRAGDSALDDRFFRSLFDMSDWMGSAGPSSIPRKRQTPAVSASTPTADSASITTIFSNSPETQKRRRSFDLRRFHLALRAARHRDTHPQWLPPS